MFFVGVGNALLPHSGGDHRGARLTTSCRTNAGHARRAKLQHDAGQLRRGWLLAVLGVLNSADDLLAPALRPCRRASRSRLMRSRRQRSVRLPMTRDENVTLALPAARRALIDRPSSAPSEAAGAAYYVLFGVTVGFAMHSPFSPSRKLANL